MPIEDIIIRNATIDDYHAFIRLDELMNRHHYESYPEIFKPALVPYHTEHMYHSLLQLTDRAIIVAVDTLRLDEVGRSIVCGFAATRIVEARPSHSAIRCPKTIYIDEIIVDVGYRRCGVAKKLMSQIESIGRSRNVAKVVLTVFAANKVAVDFYESSGFAMAKVEMEKTLK